MNRRDCLLTLAALPIAAAATLSPRGARAGVPSTPRTRWLVSASEGLDALCFLGPLSGDPFYARYYSDELAQIVPKLGADIIGTLQQLKASAGSRNVMLGPFLSVVFSAGSTATLAQVRKALDEAEQLLFPGFRASAYWNEKSWAWMIDSRPALQRVLAALAAADFPALRQKVIGDRAERRIAALRQRLAGIDVIAEQERLLGRRLEPAITIELLHFSKPHGIKVIGQRFLTHLDYADEVVIRNAAHEMLHPPFDVESPPIRAALSVLERDPLLARIVTEHNPSFGYTTLEGLFNEDTAEALDQLVSERLGVAKPAGERWRKHDDGMHVLAAGLYGLLKAEGYDKTGGVIQDWLGRAAKDGRLAPASLHAAAASVLKLPKERLWTPPAQGVQTKSPPQ
ncbi:hypothetical protein [Archangium lansingense]|uniref:Uncharacterized protein n=1 Tax=Archangium lansingense TaxID=2995310 RepID=A0ABT4A8L0_9BACT|nr:hypothetical protein [Archangium lansinium]MCY1077272.1 hypothetical protein [Archangium lansinium]